METPKLGRRELEIMNVVWELGQATVRDVYERLPQRPAYTTVLTMMRGLEEKKRVLVHEEVGRVHLYRATLPRQQVRSSLLADLRDLLFGGSTVTLINNLVTQEPLTAQEEREIRNLLGSTPEAQP